MNNWRSSLIIKHVYRYPGGNSWTSWTSDENGFNRPIKIKENSPVLCISQIGDNYYNLVVLETENGETFWTGQYFMSYGWKQNPEIELPRRTFHLLLAGEKAEI